MKLTQTATGSYRAQYVNVPYSAALNSPSLTIEAWVKFGTAWAASSELKSTHTDTTAADAARVAHEADVGDLTLLHLNPKVNNYADLIQDARPAFDLVTVGEDEMVLAPAHLKKRIGRGRDGARGGGLCCPTASANSPTQCVAGLGMTATTPRPSLAAWTSRITAQPAV